jgi:hypothetical protein
MLSKWLVVACLNLERASFYVSRLRASLISIRSFSLPLHLLLFSAREI